jgi:hypothetical protein
MKLVQELSAAEDKVAIALTKEFMPKLVNARFGKALGSSLRLARAISVEFRNSPSN